MREIIVKSSRPLTKNQIDKINKFAVQKYGNDYTLQTSVETSLVGGVIIYDNGEVIDASYSTQIKKVKSILLNK